MRNAVLTLFAVLALVPPASAQDDGTTPLHWAAYKDDVAGATALIKAGVNVNAANDLGATPLWLASQNGSAPIVRALLEAGADPNRALLAGESPVMIAARSGSAEVVELLAAKGANLNARGARGQTALMWAVAQRHADVVRVLLARGADVNGRSDVWGDIMAVPPHGRLEYNRWIPHGGDTALIFAARVGDVASARLLVAAGANVNDKDAWGISAVAYAVHAGFPDLVDFLLEKGASPNAPEADFAPIHAAVMRRDLRVAEALLTHGADSNAPLRSWTPMRRDSLDFHFPQHLVGASPLWLAARFTDPMMMRLLAKHGADPKFVHNADYVADTFRGDPHKLEATTVLMAAVGMGTPGVREWMPIAPPDREPLTLEAVKVALELGVDLNAIDKEGRTALDGAKALKIESVVNLLTQKDTASR